MAITDSNPNFTSGNLRAMKRYLQGRGINLRQTIVDGEATGVRIPVPGLKADDKIISVINFTDGNDISGYLATLNTKASLTLFSADKGLRFTARQPGVLGNEINVRARTAPDVNLPLSVEIGPWDTLNPFPGIGHPGKTLILVSLATDENGIRLNTAVNSAAAVRVAIINAMGIPAGGRGHIVDVDLTGDGSTSSRR
jgi:hypothetical protein